MSWLQSALGAIGIVGEQRSSAENTISVSAGLDEWNEFFGIMEAAGQLPRVSIDAALQVPAVWCITNFLPRTLAALPLHTFEAGDNGAKADDERASLLNFAPNPTETSFSWRVYFWHQVFTGGRGLAWIERIGTRPVSIWPMDPGKTQIVRRQGKKVYIFDGKEYPAEDVIDVPFLLKRDRLASYSPIAKCNKAISLAIAMGDFAGTFFQGGGIPPLALTGPLPDGKEAFKRAQNQIDQAIRLAKQQGRSFTAIPPGHELNPIGIDPAKGQMTEARLFQIQECARIWQMPPVFVQDLSKGTFSNTEQQDLQLVKHLIGQWAKCFEDELTLKLYGWRKPDRRVKHNLDGLQRGVFKDRIEALARAIMTGQLTPDEARALENRGPQEGGHRLYIQGATVPLTMAGTIKTPTPSNDQSEEDDADGGDGTQSE